MHPLLGQHVRLLEEPERHVWQAEVGTTALPWLGDHQVHNVAALPGAAYCEMALAAARAVLGEASEVRDITFEQMLLLDREDCGHRRASVEAPGVAHFAVETDDDGEHTRRAGAILHAGGGRPAAVRTTWPRCSQRTPCRVEGTELRQRLEKRGVQFGPAFTGLAAAHTGRRE